MSEPIRTLFASDVTRDIPPVVYFHEQSPEKLHDEVSEYIITGGWPADHPNRRRVPDGIHEQYVQLLTRIADELDKKQPPDLPTVWISGFYGSGKSSFAKLLGLALDGVALPDGRSLAEALIQRDTSPRADELRRAWARLRQKVDPIAVVFDVGGMARDDEHVHAVAVRQVQRRLGYSNQSGHVANGELLIERDGRWADLERACQTQFGKPWAELRDSPQAQARFSNLMAALYPDLYKSERDWHMRHGGMAVNVLAPVEAALAIGDMLRFRAPNATLFLVIDEVSQYVLANDDRVERLRAFAEALGGRLKGKVWLLALGQQKLEEEAGNSFLVKTKDRFPPRLRVHLAPTNIQDVVHKRLLHKAPAAEAPLRALFERHRAELQLYGYKCADITPDAFVEVYPMLPGQIDLLLQITSAMRTRSSRAQGDDQAIRGLLQLLGELFRDQKLADAPIGALVTLDQIYEVQHSALEADTQASMSRILRECAHDPTGQLVRVAKAVALLELIQETEPTDARLVAQCLYDRVDRGNHAPSVLAALEELRRQNLLGYSEKTGYKLQSSSAEEWERDRRDISATQEDLSKHVQGALKLLVSDPERPRHQGRSFPWAATYSDGRREADVSLLDPRDDAAFHVDLRFIAKVERAESAWVKRSDETALQNRLVWVVGDREQVEHLARELHRSEQMVAKYKPRLESLSAARKMLLQSEQNRVEDLRTALKSAIADAFLAGRMYFRGRALAPTDHGTTFGAALGKVAELVLPGLFPHFVGTTLAPTELMQLLAPELSGPSPKFMPSDLGILELDGGRYVPTCSGIVPRRVLEHIEREGGLSGASLIAWFGSPPFGYPAPIVKACVAGLLRGGRVRVQPDGVPEIGSIRDTGARDLFDRDRDFRRAAIFPAGEDDIGVPGRARICKFFEEQLDYKMDREDNAIADAVSTQFPRQAQRLRGVLDRLNRLPGHAEAPPELARLQDVLEKAVASSRRTKPTVQLVKARLDALRDGFDRLNRYDAELTDAAIAAVRHAATVRDHHLAQLLADGHGERVAEQARAIDAQLGGARPWIDIAGIQADVDAIVALYAQTRRARLVWQEAQAEEARGRVRHEDGFATLTADQSHQVLRPIALAVTNTSEDAVAPTLEQLVADFEPALKRAIEQALDTLDGFRSTRTPVVKLEMRLKNRVVKTEAEVEGIVGELRERLMKQIEGGVHVRLV
jgi:hypothetical protein